MTSDGPIWQWSAHEVVAAIRAGDPSSVDAVSSVVERMRATNGRVNAVTVDLGDEAVAKAREADRVVASGVSLGALHGVPVTIKENVDQKGQATPNGLVSLKDLVAPDDAPVARNLRAAGAIIIGRTNTPEMSLRAFTSNPLRGATVNPWSDNATCGGSSGGAPPSRPSWATVPSPTGTISVARSASPRTAAASRPSAPPSVGSRPTILRPRKNARL